MLPDSGFLRAAGGLYVGLADRDAPVDLIRIANRVCGAGVSNTDSHLYTYRNPYANVNTDHRRPDKYAYACPCNSPRDGDRHQDAALSDNSTFAQPYSRSCPGLR